jgi:hypothetical protein
MSIYAYKLLMNNADSHQKLLKGSVFMYAIATSPPKYLHDIMSYDHNMHG